MSPLKICDNLLMRAHHVHFPGTASFLVNAVSGKVAFQKDHVPGRVENSSGLEEYLVQEVRLVGWVSLLFGLHWFLRSPGGTLSATDTTCFEFRCRPLTRLSVFLQRPCDSCWGPILSQFLSARNASPGRESGQCWPQLSLLNGCPMSWLRWNVHSSFEHRSLSCGCHWLTGAFGFSLGVASQHPRVMTRARMDKRHDCEGFLGVTADSHTFPVSWHSGSSSVSWFGGVWSLLVLYSPARHECRSTGH